MSVVTITKENFRQEVLQSRQPVLLDFWADWCAPCRRVGPVVDEIAGERPDIKVGKVDVTGQRELAAAFQVASIPMLVVLEGGRVVCQTVGAQPKEAILSLLPSVRQR